MFEDSRWFGFHWSEGPDIGGTFTPYTQSERRTSYIETFKALRRGGWIYPCRCSRRDVERALAAPHTGEEEPVYPGTCRADATLVAQFTDWNPSPNSPAPPARPAGLPQVSWRFRVPDGETISFVDGGAGAQAYVAGRDFGDFVVWRHDDVPAYQLAVVSDDIAMRITEVVRGRDLLMSTARQLLLYRALGAAAPGFFHCPLMLDSRGVRLAKRHDALSLRALREQGMTPEMIRASESFRG